MRIPEATDAGSMLLARHAIVPRGAVAAHLSCGDAAFGAAAADAGAARILLADRSYAVVQAVRAAVAAYPAIEVHYGHGALAFPAGVSCDVVAITIPREKAAVRQLLWDAFGLLREGGRCYVAGANNEGARPAARALQDLFGSAQTVAHGGGSRLVSAVKLHEAPGAGFTPPPGAAEFHETRVVLRGRELTLFSRPGVFSWDHLDEATALLADVMEVREGEAVLDLGCGSGALGTLAAHLSVGGRVCMVDADSEAVRSAARTAAHAGVENVEVLPGDVASPVIDERFDVVVTNPPFHAGGRSTDLALPLRFIEDAWTVLKPGGRLYLVANRTLPYEQPVRARFGNMTTIAAEARFKVLGATKAA